MDPEQTKPPTAIAPRDTENDSFIDAIFSGKPISPGVKGTNFRQSDIILIALNVRGEVIQKDTLSGVIELVRDLGENGKEAKLTTKYVAESFVKIAKEHADVELADAQVEKFIKENRAKLTIATPPTYHWDKMISLLTD